MRIDVLGLQAFVAIAERGSFRAAAAHLNLSQTALSHRIRKLEESLAAPVLLRTTRHVSLAPAGLALLPRARQVFEDLGLALDEARLDARQAAERVVIGCLPTVAMGPLPRALADFARERPGLPVKVEDSSAAAIAEKVRAGAVEFGVTILTAGAWDIDARPVAREPFVLVCHRRMPLADRPFLTWDGIEGLPLVRASAETGNRVLIDDALGGRREALSWRYEAQRVTTAVGLVRAVDAYAIVPRLAFDVAGTEDLVSVPLRDPVVTRTLGIIARKGLPLRPATSSLAEHVARALTASLGPLTPTEGDC